MIGGISRGFRLVNYLLLALLGLVSVVLLVDFGRQVVINRQRHTELVEVEKELEAAVQRVEELEAQLRYSESLEAAEAWGRQLGWTRADERSLVIVDASQYPSLEVWNTPRQSSSEASLSGGWWSRLFNQP